MTNRYLSSVPHFNDGWLDLDQLVVLGELQPCSDDFDAVGEQLDISSVVQNMVGPSRNIYVATKQVIEQQSFPDSDEDFALPDEVFDPTARRRRCRVALEFETSAWNYSRWQKEKKDKTSHAFVVSVLQPVRLDAADATAVLKKHSASVDAAGCVGGSRRGGSDAQVRQEETNNKTRGDSAIMSAAGANGDAVTAELQGTEFFIMCCFI